MDETLKQDTIKTYVSLINIMLHVLQFGDFEVAVKRAGFKKYIILYSHGQQKNILKYTIHQTLNGLQQQKATLGSIPFSQEQEFEAHTHLMWAAKGLRCLVFIYLFFFKGFLDFFNQS